MEATSKQQSRPLVTATCKLGKNGCFSSGKCHALGSCENKIVTNADRIRAMSDEELAAFWASQYDNFCQYKPECGEALDKDDLIPDEWCVTCALEWLRKPAEEVTGNA